MARRDKRFLILWYEGLTREASQRFGTHETFHKFLYNGRKKKANTKNIDMANHMFEEVAPKYADPHGGYTRMIKIGARRGDGAEVVIIELV